MLPPQIFTRATDWPRLASAHPERNGGPPKNFNRENLKFGLKFSVLPSITSGLLGVSSQNFFQSTCRKAGLINCFSDFRYENPFRRYLRSKVESCQKWRKILDDFFALANFLPSKNCTQFINPALRHVDWKKFCGDTPSSPKVIEGNTLNFRPIFKFQH